MRLPANLQERFPGSAGTVAGKRRFGDQERRLLELKPLAMPGKAVRI
jgi:hypothetical protein